MGAPNNNSCCKVTNGSGGGGKVAGKLLINGKLFNESGQYLKVPQSSPSKPSKSSKSSSYSTPSLSLAITTLRHLLLRAALLPLILLVLLYDILTLPVYFLAQQPWKRWPRIAEPRSVREQSTTPGEVICSSVKTAPSHPDDHFLLQCRTIDEALDRALEHRGEQAPCLGYRQVLASHTELVEGKPVLKKALTPEYSWLTYGAFYRALCRFGHGLARLGIGQGEKVMIFAETCPQWLIAGQGIIKNGSVLVTLYSTLGDAGIVHGLNETEVQYVITSRTLAEKLVRLRGQLARPLKRVIILDEGVSEEEMKQLQEAFRGKKSENKENENKEVEKPKKEEEEDESVELSSMEELIESGDADHYKTEAGRVTIRPSDVAIIMYTSGSGGVPKGVMITHHNVLIGMWSILSLVWFFVEEMPTHTYIGYLPLAHILEFATETFLVLVGARIGYSSPHTITDLSVGLVAGTRGDASLLRPTLMASVPLVCDRIRKAIYARLNSKGLLVVRLFEYLIDYKTFWMSKGFTTPILDRLFFSKFNAIVGGRLQIMMTGGAALSADTQKFIRAVLNVTFAQGYGSTETVASGLFMDEHDQTLAKVGGPLYACQVKLVDWPEGGYCTADRPNPRGEIHLSSESISAGYYRLERLTEEAYYVDEQGRRWFRSGDIGELYPNGTFKIIDRKKSFIKLQFGEYISLGKIETKLKTSYLVNNVCVVGNSLYNSVIAIVVPNPKAVTAIGRALGLLISGSSSRGGKSRGGKGSASAAATTALDHHQLLLDEEALYSSDQVKERMLAKLAVFARANGLRRYEIPRGLILVKDDWTPEGGLVTASFKLKRKSIEQHYHEAIHREFSRLE